MPGLILLFFSGVANYPYARPPGTILGFAAHNTTWRIAVLAGFTTFITMAYIIFVNPAILSATGMPLAAVTTSTCLCAAFGSILMGALANYPLALAPGMGFSSDGQGFVGQKSQTDPAQQRGRGIAVWVARGIGHQESRAPSIASPGKPRPLDHHVIGISLTTSRIPGRQQIAPRIFQITPGRGSAWPLPGRLPGHESMHLHREPARPA